MLRDIEAGRVNMVITKDLSRLGRDYIMTGHYMERYFPEHRVRYISLLDGIDTGVDSSANEITPFRAIMNDMYAKDISKKISSSSTLRASHRRDATRACIPPVPDSGAVSASLRCCKTKPILEIWYRGADGRSVTRAKSAFGSYRRTGWWWREPMSRW